MWAFPVRLLLLLTERGLEAGGIQHDSLKLRLPHVSAGQSIQVGLVRL